MDAMQSIARTILQGFDRHYRLFTEISAGARAHFEAQDWPAARVDSRERILMYEQRVRETVDTIERRFPKASHDYESWPRIKRTFIGLLLDHLQPECAETFYNSVACRVLHRRYYRNDYIFWRPTLNTDNLEGEHETYQCFYPDAGGLRRSLLQILTGVALGNRFANLRRDVRSIERALLERRPRKWRAHPNHQLQVLGSLFFRNKAAYVVGREVNGDETRPFIIPLLHDASGRIFADAVLTRRKDASILFSFTRAYFMVEMDVPSAYVRFLSSIMPTKSKVDLYAILGLQKHAKTLFYREMQHHLKHSRDDFRIAPGIPGTVMLVFTLPSFPYVIKVIRDQFKPPKVTNHEHVKERYALVKFHDRVGRLADTLEYSDVAIPLDRVEPELLAEITTAAAGSAEVDGERLVVRHCYIERRMVPLNEYLAHATPRDRRRVILDYGNAIRELAGANIFPGDMMHKNFGVTRLSRVVFYDYDEICYMTECQFRHLPPAGGEMDELAAEPCFSIEEHDVFPETFGSFFFPDPQLRKIFLRHHHDLVTPGFWQQTRDLLARGGQSDVYPYAEKLRFRDGRGDQGVRDAA